MSEGTYKNGKGSSIWWNEDGSKMGEFDGSERVELFDG